MRMNKKAVILLSGGLDSTTCLAIAKAQNFNCYAISFNYGQRQQAELNAAKKIAKAMGVIEHRIIELPLNQFGGSALTDTTLDIPHFEKNRKEIPITYVPARNTIFLSIALGWAEVLNAYDIFYGANAVDYSGYADCRPEYVAAFEKLANLATKAGIEGQNFKIHTPLIHLTKAEIIQLGTKHNVNYGLTVSCYQADPEGKACGHCDSCMHRKQGFTEANIPDPTLYY